MLRIVMQKAALDQLDITPVVANLVELDKADPPIAPASVDHAMCLFSTLGMIRGSRYRLQALTGVRRILKPGGRLVLHVHNYWFTLHDPGGWLWVAKNMAQSLVQRETEVGDRYFPYRGLPTMYLHTFRPRELRSLLRSAGFRIRRWIPLEVTRKGPLPHAWWFESLRANGWIVVAE
jgi:SAM-dependent methyltransferase